MIGNEFERLRRNILLNSGGGLPAGYEWATDADFSGTTNGTFKYIGTKQYVAIPHIIKGINVTSYANMFRDKAIKGVYSDNMSVRNMSNMFYNSQATSLNLSSFDTSKVTTMYAMFYNSKATSLNLSSFDTSKVTNMSNMFRGSKVPSLDLSSFDISKVNNTDFMFYDALTTTGYARTQADADKFNRSSYKPSALRFIVKPK